MRQFTLLSSALVACCVVCAAQAEAKTYTAEPPREQKATYNESENAITISAKAPKYTEYDWETYEQDELPYISYVTIFRHTPGESWPDTECGRVSNPTPGETFEFVDKNVEPDKKYEYRMACYVDDTKGSEAYVQAYSGTIPGQLSSFTASTDNHLTTTVDLTFTAPTTTSTGDALTKTMSIDIERYTDLFTYTKVHSIENVEPGKTYSWQDTGLALNDTYRYRAYARLGENGTGDLSDAEVYVGLDKPGVPQNFKATASGTSVTLSWEKPLKGAHNGSYDPATTTYELHRVYIDGSDELVDGNITGTNYTDTPALDEEQSLSYTLTAKNASGESNEKATAGPVVAGNYLQLPFKESFANQKLEHLGWSTLTTQNDPYYTYKAWEFVETGRMYYYPTDDYLDIAPQDADGGLASCIFYGYSEDGQTESLVSPHIDVNGKSQIGISFCYYDVCSQASNNTASLLISTDDGQWEKLFTSTPSAEVTTPQWKEVSEQYQVPAGTKNVRVRIDAVKHDGSITNVYVDNIKVVDQSQSSVDGIGQNAANAPKQYFNLQGVALGNERPTTTGIYVVKQGKRAHKEVVK